MDMRIVARSTRYLLPANSYLPKFSKTKLGYLNHIQYRPNPLAN